MTVPYHAAFGLNAYTVSTWVDVTTQPASGNSPALLSTRNGAGFTFDLQYSNNSGTYSLHSDIGSGASWLNNAANYTLPGALTGWNMVTCTVSSSGYAIYLDGNQVSSGTTGGGTPLFMASGQTLSLGSQEGGGSSYGSGGYLSGALDDTNIFGSVLTAAESAISTWASSASCPRPRRP